MLAWLMIWYSLGLSMKSGYSCLSRTWVTILGSDMINACKSNKDFQTPISLGHGPCRKRTKQAPSLGNKKSMIGVWHMVRSTTSLAVMAP